MKYILHYTVFAIVVGGVVYNTIEVRQIKTERRIHDASMESRIHSIENSLDHIENNLKNIDKNAHTLYQKMIELKSSKPFETNPDLDIQNQDHVKKFETTSSESLIERIKNLFKKNLRITKNS